MTDDRVEYDDMLASGTHCPMPECGALVVAYRCAQELGLSDEPWEFHCARCGADFIAIEADLVFQAVPPVWLQGGIYAA